jgi:hypothetical protein
VIISENSITIIENIDAWQRQTDEKRLGQGLNTKYRRKHPKASSVEELAIT